MTSLVPLWTYSTTKPRLKSAQELLVWTDHVLNSEVVSSLLRTWSYNSNLILKVFECNVGFWEKVFSWLFECSRIMHFLFWIFSTNHFPIRNMYKGHNGVKIYLYQHSYYFKPATFIKVFWNIITINTIETLLR